MVDQIQNMGIANSYQVGNGNVGAYEGALTPEGLMIYLSTRLNSIDDRINQIFEKQQSNEAVRRLVNEIHNELAKLSENQANPDALVAMPDNVYQPGDQTAVQTPAGTNDIEKTINAKLDQLAQLDPQLADTLRSKLNENGQILYVQDGLYFGRELTASKKLLDTIVKDLDSAAQMNMIQLQSMMSSRQTAIQLSTNLVSALGESLKAVASNIGR